jgi:MinD-like ATPase involved in chromosome partitioning or flagellar assembly
MAKIIAVHSYRGGTGKSNITANLAAVVARRGRRVGVVDTDIQSPGIHVLFGFDAANAERSLNGYLWGQCGIQDAAHDVTATLHDDAPGSSSVDTNAALYLAPASIRPGDIARILREGYDVDLLSDGLDELARQLDLDYLFVDTHPGLHEETLSCIASSDALLLVLRPDHQDYQGTAVTVEVARKLDMPEMWLVANKVLPRLDGAALREQVARAYGTPVAGVLPVSEELMALGSVGLFSVRHPDHPWSRELGAVVGEIAGEAPQRGGG